MKKCFERDCFPLSDTMAISSFNQNIVDISQVNIKRLIRDVGEKEVTRLLKQIMENNMMLLNLQRQILKLQVTED